MYVEACGARSSRARLGPHVVVRGAARSFTARASTTLAAVTLGLLALACSASVGPSGDAGGTPDGPRLDGGPGDLASFDTSIDSPFRPPSCQIASLICVGNELHACAAGTAGDLITTCPDACSYGRCTSAVCVAAEQNDPLRGCRFYPVQVDNVDADDAKQMMLILTNSSSVPANAYLQVRLPAGDWTSSSTVVVPAHGSARLEANRAVLAAGVTPAAAFRLEADRPVSVIQIVSDDVDRASTSSGGTVLRPIHALDSNYMAVAYQQVASSPVAATAGGRSGAGMIAVVGTVDHTTVNVQSAAALLVAPTTTRPPGTDPYSVVLDEGDVLQIFSAEPAADLTGTRIAADHPVEVLSGNVFTSYNYEMTGLNGADLAFEQLPPIKGWSNAYVGAWLAPQAGCDPYFGKGAGSWQVLAATDDTLVTITPSDTTVIVTDTMAVVTDKAEERMFRLNAGMTKRFAARPLQTLIDAGGPLPPSDFVVKSPTGHPILLVQWLDCEPALALGIDARLIAGGSGEVPAPPTPPEDSQQEVVIAFPPGFDHQLVIVRRAGSPVSIDGAAIGDAEFHRITPKEPFEVARYSSDDLGPCIDLSDGCSHVIRGAGVGVSWRGMDVVCSYAVTLPSTDACQLSGIKCEG